MSNKPHRVVVINDNGKEGDEKYTDFTDVGIAWPQKESAKIVYKIEIKDGMSIHGKNIAIFPNKE